MPSSCRLSAKLMNTCTDRLLGAPLFAKVTYPRLLLSLTGSSGMVDLSHLVAIDGSPWMPHCTTKPGTTLKNFTPL